MSFIPRDYQNAAHAALINDVHVDPKGGKLVILPTGTGKSLSMAMFMWHMLRMYPWLRIMMCTHVKELIEGNYKTLLKLWPAAPAGVYSAGLGRKDVYSQLTFAGIQSVYNRPGRFGKIDFLLVDEAHLISNNDKTTYRKFIAALREKNPNLIVIGFTATAFRMGTGMLTEGEDAMFDKVVFDGGGGEAFIWFIEQGYLIKPVPMDPGFQVDESKVRLSGGEYKSSDAEAAFHDQDILERAVDRLIQVGDEEARQSMLTFCQSIEDADLVADMFRYKGKHVEAIHSKREDRDDVLAAYKAGELWGITNRDILTTGFDHPPIDLMGILRLTRSPGLWVQILGRGTRPVYVNGYYEAPPIGSDLTVWHNLQTLEGRLASIADSHKQNCRVLDFAGNTERLGPINYPVVPKARRKGKRGEPPSKKCPECNAYHHTSVKICDNILATGVECGYEFPPPKRFTDDASKQDLVLNLDLSELPPPPEKIIEVIEVHEMLCTHHNGKTDRKGNKLKPDTMRVDYRCGFSRYSKWVCFEHRKGTFPRNDAERWWRLHGGRVGRAPDNIMDAVEQAAELNKPRFIKVVKGDKFPEIVDYDFEGTAFELPPSAGGPPLKEPTPDPMEQTQSSYQYSGYYDDDIPF